MRFSAFVRVWAVRRSLDENDTRAQTRAKNPCREPIFLPHTTQHHATAKAVANKGIELYTLFVEMCTQKH